MRESFIIKGSNGRPMAADLHFDAGKIDVPILLYAHGFNGFKDWGNGNLMAQKIVDAGFVVLKFNFSHNGTTPEAMEEFIDLEAFSENNYTKQLFDLSQILQWITHIGNPYKQHFNINKIGLIGHSMGGGIAILLAANDSSIKALCTWAAIGECKTPWGNWSQAQLEAWRTTGTAYYFNGRTRQELPMRYQLYLDHFNNKAALDIHAAAKNIAIPWLICHGTGDTSVPPSVAASLHQKNPNSTLFITDGDHVFDRKHPWHATTLPLAANKLLTATTDFFRFTFS